MNILWRRLDHPGHEAARLGPHQLDGSAVFEHEGEPCRLEYVITFDDAFRTESAKVTGFVGDEAVDVSVSRREIEQLGCIDIDLNFSPSTNLLPIRRLNLAVGEEAEVRAAWLRFPSFKLELLEQIYRRTGPDTYRYSSAGGKFVRDLRVNAVGFVTDYPNFWTEE